MADASKTGTDWKDDELDAIVADYFAMLALDAAGEHFVKAHRARALMERTGRSHRSVEFKHMNISAVAAELGLPHVRGYRPLANYQAAIFDAIDRHLDAYPEILGDDALSVAQLLANGSALHRAETKMATGSHQGVAESAARFEPAGRSHPPLMLTEAPPPGPLAPHARKASPASSANTIPPPATTATERLAYWARNASSITSAPV